MDASSVSDQLARLRTRYERERRSRREAERIADEATGKLYASLQELEKLNVELVETIRDLENANQALHDFVGIASHDLRDPLTAILGFVSTMRVRWADLDDDRRSHFLWIVEKQALHLNRLVEDLLTVSKIESGAVEARIEEIILRRTLAEAVVQLGDTPPIRVLGPPDLRVLADPNHLVRILHNYITNAIKYGAAPIEASCADAGEWAEIRIRDAGDGVPPEFVPRLFEKFARAESRSVREREGTGLGLSIVRGLARANGGDAWYEPNRPKGSCFAVRLPKAS